MKRWKPTAIVLVLFAALLAYVLLVEVKKDPPPEEDASPTPVPILEMAVGDLQVVHVTDGERSLRLVRDREAGQWRIVEPTDDLADEITVMMPLNDLARLEAKEIVLEQLADPATYGLAKVALTLTIELESGETEQIFVGRKTPDESAFYLQRQGDPRLYIVSYYILDPFFDWLSAPPYQPTPTPAPAG